MTEAERIHEVENKIKGWRLLKERVKEAEAEAAAIAFAGGAAGGPVQTSTISDKTYRGAELLAAVEKDVAWIATIQEGMDYLKEEHPELFYLLKGHYGMIHRKGYSKNRAGSFERSYRNTYFIGHSAYFERRKTALKVLADIALQNGLQYVTRSYKVNSGAAGGKKDLKSELKQR